METAGSGEAEGLERTPRGAAERVAPRARTLEAIIGADGSGRIVSWDAGAQALFGFDKKEAIGQPLTIIIPERFRRAHQAGLQAARRGGFFRLVRKAEDLAGLRKDGSEFPIELVLCTWNAPHGTFFSALVQDLTERRQVEESLRLLRFALDTASDPAFIMGPDGGFVYVNDAACKALGYSRAELLEMGVPDIDPDFPAERWPAHWEEVRKERRRFLRSHHRTKDGRIFPVEITASYLVCGGKEYNCAFARDVTNREWTEEHRKLLSSMVEQSHEAMAVTDLEGNILFVNRAFAAAHGYEELDLIGMHISMVHTAEEADALARAKKELMEKGEFRGEIWHLRRDGSQFPALVQNSLLRDDDGTTYGIILTAHDITERKKAEELAFWNGLLAAQIEHAPDGVLVVDEQGKMISFNQRFVSMWGIPEEIVRSRSDEEALKFVLGKLVDPQGFLSRVHYLYQHREERSRDEIELEDGRVFERHSSPVLGPRKEYYGRVWYFRDISDHKRAQAELRESRELLQAILDNTTAVIYVKDTEGRYLLINHRYEELFHTSKEGILGKLDRDIFPEPAAAAFRANDLAVLQAARPLEFEEKVPQDDGIHTYISLKFPLRDGTGSPYAVCGISTDITERSKEPRQT